METIEEGVEDLGEEDAGATALPHTQQPTAGSGSTDADSSQTTTGDSNQPLGQPPIYQSGSSSALPPSNNVEASTNAPWSSADRTEDPPSIDSDPSPNYPGYQAPKYPVDDTPKIGKSYTSQQLRDGADKLSSYAKEMSQAHQARLIDVPPYEQFEINGDYARSQRMLTAAKKLESRPVTSDARTGLDEPTVKWNTSNQFERTGSQDGNELDWERPPEDEDDYETGDDDDGEEEDED
jgi:hypothetical protein